MKIDYKKLLNFNPTNREGLIMFGLYVGLIMFLYGKNGIGLVFWLISIFLYFSTKEEMKEECRNSSIDNPYSNMLWENDNLKACKTDPNVIKNNFEENLYRNETDLFDRKSMQGWYYQVEDTYPNNIKPLLNAFESDKRCKSDNINCMYPSFFLN